MEKSIENIWKEGFKTEKGLKIPEVRNLYESKSKLLVERFKSTSKKDNISLIPIAVILCAVFAFLGKIILGAYVALLIILLYFLNKKMMTKLNETQLNSNIYQYILNYHAQLKSIQSFYTRLLAFGLPLVIIPGYWMYFQGTDVTNYLVSLAPIKQVLLVAMLTMLLSGLGVLSYKLSTRLVYGRLLHRLENMIDDMEASAKT